MRIGILSMLLVIGWTQIASAVIVAGHYANVSDTNVNTTAPADDPGFQYVASVGDTNGVGGASAVYLGKGWVLTAAHVTLGLSTKTTLTYYDSALGHNVTSSYSLVPNSGVVLKNPSGTSLPGAGLASDVELYRIDTSSSPFGAPDLPSLNIASDTQSVGSMVTGIGRGWDRTATVTGFNSSWGTTPPYSFYGYTLGTGDGNASHASATQVMRWGDNTIATGTQVWNVGTTAAPVYVNAFTTQFDRTGGTYNEFQATNGDSGGAVFSKVDGVWQLSGMIDAVTLANGMQPVTDSAFTDSTVIADLSMYRSQIINYVPEPGTGVLAAAGLLFLVAIARRRMVRS